MDRILLASHAS
jgi:hypothetical protein